MDKKPQAPETYDKMFKDGGAGGVFDLPYRVSGYYPLFNAVAQELIAARARRVLEVGCGTGPMAHLLMDRSTIDYQGFDFSPLAVEKARRRTSVVDKFTVADATAAQTYAGREYDSIICTEVLEHIERDLETIGHWKAGTFCVCSVPNYDSDTHVRYFRTEKEVCERYGHLIEIGRIRRLKKPMLSDISFAAWLRAVRWNRYRPSRLKWLLGFSNFDRDGGWFVFSGSRLSRIL
jgi:cyclopropane fatty-acyl-phospholipid synthase-like methyltransferase